MKTEKHPAWPNSEAAADNSSVLSRLSMLFRFVGVATLFVSAVVFMLQGLDNIALDLRQWVWLSAIFIAGAGGLVCLKLFHDPSGARVFFIMATLLVPVQFSQLGGMIHEWLSVSGTGNAERLANIPLLLNIAISLIIATGIAAICNAILVRRRVKALTVIFLAINVLILFPTRIDIMAFVVIATMVLLLAGAQAFIFKRNSVFKTGEAKILRLLMLFPLAVVVVRNSFHIESAVGVAAMGGTLATVFLYVLPSWPVGKMVREFFRFCGAFIAAASWFICYGFVLNTFAPAVLLVPLSLLCFELSRISLYKTRYRDLACLLHALSAVWVCILAPQVVDATLVFVLSLGLVAVGFLQRVRNLVVVGGAASILAFVSLCIMALGNITVNIWLTLAVLGLVLMLLSSAVVKYGRYFVLGWEKVGQFD